MTFERPWMALAAILPFVWLAWEWRRTNRKLGLALKALSLAAVLFAISEPRLSFTESKVALAVMVDTSASVSAEDLRKASALVSSILNRRGSNFVQVIPFGRQTRALTKEETANGLTLMPSAGEGGTATAIESALREATAALPAGMVPKVILISDGKENAGSAVRAAWQARQQGIRVDTFPLMGRAKPELRLDSVQAPAQAFAGEKFAIELAITSPRSLNASIDLSAEGKALGSNDVTLQHGKNIVHVNASIQTAGAVELTGTIKTKGAGDVRFAQAVSLRKPRLLYLSQDAPGTEVPLFAALKAAQFEISNMSDFGKGAMADYQIVVINNWDLNGIAKENQAAIEAYVKQGGGLLIIGGENNIYVEKTVEDPLMRTLPAKLAPPRSPEGTCLVLIIDKSSSMEGKKMELARLSAIGVIENLRPADLLGVLQFDNTFSWAVPIRRVEDKTSIKRIVGGIIPDGGTQIPSALSEAYRKILPISATYKHILLLTDGISEEGNSLELAKDAAEKKVTISTIGLGQDVNKNYLDSIAKAAYGKFYQVLDPASLEQIMIKDVQEHTGGSAVERPLQPEILEAEAEILKDVGIDKAPMLKGYVRFESKPTAKVVLAMDKKDPLFASWQYGLGRSAVFSSDAKARWAADWIAWAGFSKFWSNVFHDLLPHTRPAEDSLTFDSASGDLIVQYHLPQYMSEPDKVPDIFVIGPDSFRQTIAVRKVAPHHYAGRAHIGDRQGLFRVRPLEDSREFPELGHYRQEEELSEYGSNPELLKGISSFTGGQFQPVMERVFDVGGATVATTVALWYWLLVAAVILSLAELLNRKWTGVSETITEWWRGKFHAAG
jgi:uncharacterized membrane protein/uncharacterized protein YegL